jgi:hypothetical protein
VLALLATLLRTAIDQVPVIAKRSAVCQASLSIGCSTAAIPALQNREKRESYWQGILDIDALAHRWVERFFWNWFTDGILAKPDLTAFMRAWRAMIEYALASPKWEPAKSYQHELDVIVLELPPSCAPDEAYVRSKGVRAAYFIVDVTRDRLDRISGMVERGTLNLPVGEVLDLADASTARRMLDGAPHKPGKIDGNGRLAQNAARWIDDVEFVRAKFFPCAP